MRIIDADAILNEKGNSFKFGDETYYHESIIQNAPTVDAVPIDFIKALHSYYVKRSKGWKGQNMYTLYAIALEKLVQNWDYDNKISEEMICERVSTDGE